LAWVFIFKFPSKLSKNGKTASEATPLPSLPVSPTTPTQEGAGNWVVYKAANFEISYLAPVVIKEGEDDSISFFESADKNNRFFGTQDF